MPLFSKVDTLTITYRKYEYNAEYVDGQLEIVSDEEMCSIIAHYPNKKFGYDVGVLEIIKAIDGWNKVETLGHYDTNNPAKIYYELVRNSDVDTYLNKDNFYIKKISDKSEQQAIPLIPVKERYELPSMPKIEKTEPLIGISSEYLPHLASHDRKAIYKYKSPSLKFGT